MNHLLKDVVYSTKLFLTILFLLSINLMSVSQTDRDSLNNLLKNTTNDSTKIEILYHLSVNTDVLHYSTQALALAEKIKSKRGVALSQMGIGRYYLFQQKYDKALQYLTKCINNAESINDKQILVSAYRYIGYVYRMQDSYLAKNFYEKSLLLAKERQDKVAESYALSAIGNIYECNFEGKTENNKIALRYYVQSLKIREEFGSASELASSLNETSRIYRLLGMNEKATNLQIKGLELAEKSGDILNVIHLCNSIGIDYSQRINDYKKGLEYQLRAYKLAIKHEDDYEVLYEVTKSVAYSYNALGNIEKANEFYWKSIVYSDSLKANNYSYHYNLSATRFELENQLEEQKLRLKDLEILQEKTTTEKRKTQRNALLYMLVVSVLLMIVMLWMYLQKRKINNELHNRSREIDEAYKAIRESENRFKMIADTIYDIFYLYNIHDQKFEYISPGSSYLTGVKHEDNFDILSIVYSNDIEVVKQAYKLLNSGTSYDIEFRIIVNGDIKWISEKSTPIFDDAGNLVKKSGIYSDISKRKKAEEKIKIVSEHSPDILTIIDENRKIVYINKVYAGFEYDKVIGDDVLNYVPESSKETYIDWLKKVLEEGRTVNEELEAWGENMSSRYYSVQIIPIKESGITPMAYIVSRDITEEILLKEQLKKQNYFLEETGKIAKVTGWELDVNTGIIITSTGDKNNRTNKHKFTLEKALQNYLATDQKTIIEALEKTAATGEGFDLELKRNTSSGGVKWTRTIGRLKQEITDKKIIIGITQDTTDFHKTLERLEHTTSQLSQFQNALNNASIITKTDVNGKIVFANDNALKISQYTLPELLGQNHSILSSKTHTVKFWKAFWAQIKEGIIWRGEICNRAKDGTLYWVDTYIIPIYNTHGEIIEYMSIRNDITERKKKEEEIFKIKNRLDEIVNSIDDALWQVDFTTGEHYYSNGVYKIFGYTVAEFLNDKDLWWKIIHPSDLELIKNKYDNLTNTSGNSEFEYRAFHKNHTEINVYIRLKIEKNDDGIPVKLFGVFSDNTNLRKTENSLKRAQSIAKIGSWEVDYRTGKIAWSEEQHNIFEMDSDLSYDLSTAYRENVFSEDLQEIDKQVEQARQTGNGFKMEHRIKCKDNAIKYVLVIGECIKDDNGTLIGLRGTTQDITERKKSEEELFRVQSQLDSIINNIDAAMWSVDLESNYIFLNEATTRITGYESQEFFEDKEIWKKIYAPEYIQAVAQSKIELFKNNYIEGEYEIITKKGERKWVSVKRKLVKDQHNKAIRVDAIGTDITEKRKNEHELKEAKQKLESIFEEVDDVIWSVSMPGKEVIFVTPSVKKIYGITPELFTYSPEQWHYTIYDDDKLYVEKIYDRLETEGNFEIEYRIINQETKELKWIRSRGKLIKDESGNPTRLDGIDTDITTSKLAGQKLIENSAKLKEAEGIAKIGRWELDISTNKLHWSDSIYEMWEIKNEEGNNTYLKFLESIHPEDREKVNTAYTESLMSHKPYFIEHRLLLSGGRIKWIRESCRTDYDEQNNPIRSVGIAQDITNQKMAALELLKLKENLEQINEVAGIGGWEINLNTNQVDITDIARQIYATEAEEVLTVDSLCKLYKKGGNRNRISQLIKNAIENGEQFSVELELTTNRWIETIGKTEYEGDKIGRVYGTIRNITKRKIAELEIIKQNNFQKIIAEISTNLVKSTSKSIDDVIDDSLKQFGEYMEVERCFIFQFNRESMLFSNTHDWNVPGIPSYRHRIQQIPISQFPWFAKNIYLQQVFIVPDVKLSPAEAIAEKEEWESQGMKSMMFVRLDKKNEPFGVLGIATNSGKMDFTENHVAKLKVMANVISDAITKSIYEQEYIQAREKAETASKAKTEFLANMSHEIRTPMNAILGFADLLKGKTVSAKSESYLEAILSGGHSLMSLINDILDLSKIEAGKMEIHNTTVNIEVLIRELYTIFRQKAKEKNIEISYFITTETPIYLLLDEMRLRQILFNLIGNALKFTQKGSVEIHIESEAVPDKEGFINLEISVIDTGIGIPENQREIIFEPFRQMDGQSSRKYGGTGLGLAITKRLTDIMNGTIEIESKVGIGTKVSVNLNNIEISESVKITEQKNEEETDYKFYGQTILLVEDIASNREVVKGFLDLYDLKIVEAENGMQAIEKAKEIKPDLILMDMMMPIMDGYEATTKIKSDEKLNKIPIIALTASALQHNEIDIRGFCDNYLRKPVSKKALVSIIKDYLTHKIINTETNATGKGKNNTNSIYNCLNGKEKTVFKKKWEAIVELMSIDDIQQFAHELRIHGINSNNKLIEDYATKLYEYAENFEIEEMNKLFKDFIN